MRVLVDTHAYLWFVFGDHRLSSEAARLMQASENQIVLSIVSLWEIAIKVSLDKLRLGRGFEEFVQDFVAARDLEVLGVEVPHVVRVANLSWHHRDPFDRLLVAQAQVEALPLVTDDAMMGLYGVRVLW